MTSSASNFIDKVARSLSNGLNNHIRLTVAFPQPIELILDTSLVPGQLDPVLQIEA